MVYHLYYITTISIINKTHFMSIFYLYYTIQSILKFHIMFVYFSFKVLKLECLYFIFNKSQKKYENKL